ncbi:ABC transporter permease protein [Lysobacter dokdonensis DS-58]|uniref:Transport permease protein n=1 Tax=Lysobacter dokdonensis DS-58 TaxID=1300345 RepID=A0A0A2WGW7_9GAMM|nr:ABC transporter permease [Lysobacter dokdonensis]KGQ17952.1 ABC transporter permease protein [Lysobacter dokdonensis DS-58]
MSADLSILSDRPRVAEMPRARVFNAYLQEMRAECLRYLRNPGFMLPTLLFPTVFYLMFGVFLARPGSEAGRYLLAAYGTFGVMAPGLFGFGVSMAMERENGLLTLKRAMPMPPFAYLAGKMVMAMAVASGVLTLLVLLAVFVAHVPVTGAQIAGLYLSNVPGVLPFCALGLLLGTLVKGQGAPAVINMLYLPMAFLSGLWFPIASLPKAMQSIAPALPSFHLNALALDAVGLVDTQPLPHIALLAGFTVGVSWLAARRLRKVG